jgi:predicted nucleic acid-binding Zn ribbon protein
MPVAKDRAMNRLRICVVCGGSFHLLSRKLTCSDKCHRERKRTAAYREHKRAQDCAYREGPMREQLLAGKREWHAANRERIQQQKREYRKAHREQINASKRVPARWLTCVVCGGEFQTKVSRKLTCSAACARKRKHTVRDEAHRDQIVAQKRAWNAAHREQIKISNRRYIEANREQINVRRRDSRHHHQEWVNAVFPPRPPCPRVNAAPSSHQHYREWINAVFPPQAKGRRGGKRPGCGRPRKDVTLPLKTCIACGKKFRAKRSTCSKACYRSYVYQPLPKPLPERRGGWRPGGGRPRTNPLTSHVAAWKWHIAGLPPSVQGRGGVRPGAGRPRTNPVGYERKLQMRVAYESLKQLGVLIPEEKGN